MKRVYLLSLLILCIVFVHAQADSSIYFLKRIKGDIVNFTVDNLDNIYILTSTDQLKKLNANGDSMAVFNNVTKFGKVSYIDVSNPLRVLLYYKDFATIVVLDRLLNIRNTIDLRKHDIFQVQAVGLSYDNKVWVYDELENKLKKIDEDGELIFETSDFRQLFADPPTPISIYDQDGFVYLYDTLRGVMVFDYYGAMKNRLPLLGWKNFKVAGKYLFGTRSDSLYRYQPALFLTRGILLPPDFRNATSIDFNSNRAYALHKDELIIYSLR